MNNQLVQQPEQEIRLINHIPFNEMVNWYNDFTHFAKTILKKDLDYGIIPNTKKPSLFKAGAEKLRVAYGLGIEIICTDKEVNHEKFYFDCTYKAIVKNKLGQIIAECEANCNTAEKKFKLKDYKTNTFHPDPNFLEKKNTIMKMCQKRAFVGAILIATGASEFFTQDLEDIITVEYEEVKSIQNINKNSNLDMIQEIKEAKSKLELREIRGKYKGQYESNQEFKKAFDHRVYELNLDLLESLKNELDGAKNEVEVVNIMNKSEYKILETSDLKDEYKEIGDEAIKKCNAKKRDIVIKQIRDAQTLNALKSLKLLKNIEWYLMNDQEIKDLYKEMKDSFEQESTLQKTDKELMQEASEQATPTKVLVNK